MDLRLYRLHLIGAALTLVSIGIFLAFNALESKRQPLPAALSAEFAPLPVGADSLFLPAEPDIIPKVILSREPRTAWSQSDAPPFWTDPRTLDQGPLKAAAEKEISDLFASVP
jgi:hypothetical protein